MSMMPDSMPDAIAATVGYLSDDADLDALAGPRIYGGELPRSIVDQMPLKAVVIRASGGPGDRGTLAIGRTRIDVRSYGETPSEAFRVHRAAYKALKYVGRRVRGDALLHSATPEAGPISLYEPEADWPFVLSVFSVLASEDSLAG